MIKLTFKFVSARNFMCFGPEGVRLDLSKLGRVVLVRGEDRDRAISEDAVDADEMRVRSNGCGKSSLAEAIVYALYGKSIRDKLNHDDVINNRSKKGLRVEVRWDSYKVVRTRRPNALRVWEHPEGAFPDDDDDASFNQAHEITQGGMPLTQGLIDSKVGLSYETFVNTVVFRDNNAGSFLECSGPVKREIVDNLLSLSVYRQHAKSAAESRNECERKARGLAREYERAVHERDACESRVARVAEQEREWAEGRRREIAALSAKLEGKRRQLGASAHGAALDRYNEAQKRIAALAEAVSSADVKATQIRDVVRKIEAKAQATQLDAHAAEAESRRLAAEGEALRLRVRENENRIGRLVAKVGTTCPTCLGAVREENFASTVASLRAENLGMVAALADVDSRTEVASKRLGDLRAALAPLAGAMRPAEAKVRELDSRAKAARAEMVELGRLHKPEAGADERVLESQIAEIETQIGAKAKELAGVSPLAPFARLAAEELSRRVEECGAKHGELLEAERDLPYYEFWVKAFGDGGIRRFVIDGILPALNARVSHWLDHLMDGRVRLEFDSEMDETIEREPPDGDPFVYHAMSGGERRRINLAVSQAFAHVMMLNCGASSSLVFLDEVTTNIDPDGVDGVWQMIQEMAKDKQVFITTHDRDLLDMLAGCDTVNLVKEDGWTTLAA